MRFHQSPERGRLSTSMPLFLRAAFREQEDDQAAPSHHLTSYTGKSSMRAARSRKRCCCANRRGAFCPLPRERSTPHTLTSTKESAMTRFITLLATGILASPTLALAVEHNAGYRGIGYIYFSFIAVVLIYGVYDSFGKTPMYVMAPIILIGLYLMLPPV